MANKAPIKFGTIVIDKLHQFFGKSDPSACVVVTAWANEEDDGEDTEVWLEHYRGHVSKTYGDLRDESRWEVLDQRVDTSKDVIEQLKEAEKKYAERQQD